MNDNEPIPANQNCLLTARPVDADCRIRRAFRGILSYGLVFLYGFFLMFYFASEPKQFADGTQEIGVSGNDSFYHLKMASMLPEHGLVKTFPWLRFSYFLRQGDDFVSHHYGFHCLLLPFAKASEWLTGEALSGGLWAVSTFFGINVMLFFAILRAGRVPWAWIWLLLWLLLPFQFFMRHGYVRAIGPSLMCMQLLVLLVIQRRAFLILVVAALSNHVYLGSVMYTPVIIAAFAAACVTGRGGFRHFPWRIVICGFVGWLLGAVSYPYFHGMIEFLMLQVFGSGLSPDIEVGREWKPYEGVWWFVSTLAGPLLVVFVTSALLRLRVGPRLNTNEMFLTILHIPFLLLTLKARRFVEYWPAFALLNAAMLARPVIAYYMRALLPERNDRVAGGGTGRDGWQVMWTLSMFAVFLMIVVVGFAYLWGNAERFELREAWALGIAGLAMIASVLSLGRERLIEPRPMKYAALMRVCIVLVGVALAVRVGFQSWHTVREGSALRFDLPEVRKMMAFLKADSDAGDVVFTTDWDDFPLFFYHNAYNHYIVGLDPKFTHERRPELWERYVKITRGQAPARASVKRVDDEGREFKDRIDVKVADIRDHFLAKYVITDRDHQKLADQLNRDKQLAEIVFPGNDYSKCRNAPYLVFRVRQTAQPASRPAG